MGNLRELSEAERGIVMLLYNEGWSQVEITEKKKKKKKKPK